MEIPLISKTYPSKVIELKFTDLTKNRIEICGKNEISNHLPRCQQSTMCISKQSLL
jgi:hypothetical protein